MNAEQRDYLEEHLPYMLKMLRYTYAQMQQQQHYLSWNAHFESFAVHARNLTRFLTNNDKGNFKANEFASEYRAQIGDESGPMSRLQRQVFHLAKRRPKDVVAKFDIDDAKGVIDWIETNFADFLSKLEPAERALFDEPKSLPDSDQAFSIKVELGDSAEVPTACTASPIIVTRTFGAS